jgi:hypothetical protein
VRACVHRSECSYVYKYMCFYCVSKAMGSLLGEDRALVSPMLPSPPPPCYQLEEFRLPCDCLFKRRGDGSTPYLPEDILTNISVGHHNLYRAFSYINRNVHR